MVKIKRFDDLYIDTRDFWTIFNNLKTYRITPNSDKEKKLFEKQGLLIEWIGNTVQNLWPYVDIIFEDKKAIISLSDDVFKNSKGMNLTIDLKKRALDVDGSLLYMPMEKLKFLYDWVYDTTQQQLTIPGIHTTKH